MDRGNAEKIDSNSDSRNFFLWQMRWFLFGLEFFFSLCSLLLWFVGINLKCQLRATDVACTSYAYFFMEMTVHFGSREWILLILSDGIDGSSSANIKVGARSNGLGYNKPSFPLWRCVLSTDRANNNKNKPNEQKCKWHSLKWLWTSWKMQISVPFI